MTKAEIIVERNLILKILSKSDKRFINLYYIKDIRTYTLHTHTHTHTHIHTHTHRQLGGQTERCGLHIRHYFLLLK
jgi:hypothetical protein